MSNIIKSKLRVNKYGEVFTNKREINGMIKLIDFEIANIDSKCLEPACGSGNFILNIITKKFDYIAKAFKTNSWEFKKYIFKVIQNTYGIELLEDNVEECRNNILNLTINFSKKNKVELTEENLNLIKFIIKKNIIHGNTLTMKTGDNECYIEIWEWSFMNDFIFSNVYFYEKINKKFIPKLLAENAPFHFMGEFTNEKRNI